MNKQDQWKESKRRKWKTTQKKLDANKRFYQKKVVGALPASDRNLWFFIVCGLCSSTLILIINTVCANLHLISHRKMKDMKPNSVSLL